MSPNLTSRVVENERGVYKMHHLLFVKNNLTRIEISEQQINQCASSGGVGTAIAFLASILVRELSSAHQQRGGMD
jgi:hypothetical protein